MCNFRVGQQVVCISEDWSGAGPDWLRIMKKPSKGLVYTVREVSCYEQCIFPFVVLFEELRNPIMNWIPIGQFENGYLPENFRPVKTTSIEIFNAILENPKVPIKEDTFDLVS